MTSQAQPWNGSKIVPLVVIDDPKDTEPLVNALLHGGLSVIEIGLRTPKALDALKIAAGLGTIKVAAGTITSVAQLVRVIDAGAEFGISPAWSDPVMAEVRKTDFPFIPGVATVAEALKALEHGYNHQKLYPADLLGAEKFAKSLAAVLPEISLLPSGGVSEQNLRTYLAEPNVFAVSGSWIAPRTLLQEKNFGEIAIRAARAVELANG